MLMITTITTITLYNDDIFLFLNCHKFIATLHKAAYGVIDFFSKLLKPTETVFLLLGCLKNCRHFSSFFILFLKAFSPQQHLC